MKPSDLKAVFRITGLEGLVWDRMIYPGTDGSISLGISPAERHGVQYDVVPSGKKNHAAGWNSPEGFISWNINVPCPGNFELIVNSSAAAGTSEIAIKVGDMITKGNFLATASWEEFMNVTIGKVLIKQAGPVIVKFHSNNPKTWKALNLASVTLKPIK